MLSGFDHVTIAVFDVDEATERYERLLGIAPMWRGTHPELGTRASLFALSNGLAELVGPEAHDERDAGLRALLDAHGEGLIALAFATEDADICRDALRARGLKVSPPEEGQARSLGDGSVRRYRVVQVSPKQSRGIPVQVVERDAPAASLGIPNQDGGVVRAIDHVVVRTGEPEAAVSLYRDGLGIRLALDRAIDGARMLFFRVGKVTLEFVEDSSRTSEDALWGVAYRVFDIDAAHRRLQDSGFAISEVRNGAKPGTRVFTVRQGCCGVPTLFISDPTRPS